MGGFRLDRLTVWNPPDQGGPPVMRDGRMTRASELVSVTMGAKRTGLSRQYLYRLMRSGQLDYYDIGGRRMLNVHDLDTLVRSRRAS